MVTDQTQIEIRACRPISKALNKSVMVDCLKEKDMEQIKFFVGTDVSKEWLDISIVSGGKVLHHAQIVNKVAVIKRWLRQTQKEFGYDMENTLFSMEFTGLYNHHLLEVLHTLNACVWLIPGLQISEGSTSGLKRGKER